MKKLILALFIGVLSLGCLSACNNSDEEETTNTLFFYLINYYAQEGQHFTNRWLGMKEALADHGIIVTGDNDKDAKKFKIERLATSDLPSDTEIIFVNNQTWDTGLALTNPLQEYRPMAIISTCNGPEFTATQIQAYSPKTEDATLGGFSANYRKAFEDSTLHYMGAKYSDSVGHIIAAAYSAVQGKPLRDDNGQALRIPQGYWMVKSLADYNLMEPYDVVSGNPTIKKSDFDKILPYSNASASYNDFYNFASKSTFEEIKSVFDANRDAKDVVATTEKFKMGLLVPGSINDSVGAYIKYIEEYLAKVYNFEIEQIPVTGAENQTAACEKAIAKGCKAVISLQDDTNRNAAIKKATDAGVYFGIAGICQNDADYEINKKNPYFLGSIGTSIDDERKATRDITEYYLQKIIARGALS